MNTKKTFLIILIIGAIATLFYSYINNDNGYGVMMYHHYGYYDDYSELQYVFDILLKSVAFIVIIISIMIFQKQGVTKSSKYLDVLNRRLSSGNISVEEYQKILKVIENTNQDIN